MNANGPDKTNRKADRAASDWDHDDKAYYGIEYVVLAIVLVASVFLISERAQRLLEFIYSPFFIFLIIVIFAEYIILKARDRSYVLERDLDLQRKKRHEQQQLLDEIERNLKAVQASLEDIADDAENLKAVKEELDQVIDKLEHRV